MANVGILGWISGDTPKLWEKHDGKSWKSVYGFLKIFESLMRGFGQVCFASNSFSGIFVLLGLIKADPLVGLGAFIAAVAALSMSKILRQPDGTVVAGLQSYSAVLVGSVTVSLFPVFFNHPMTYGVWGGIIVMGAFSVCVGMGLSVLLSPVNLPVYTLPFNVTTSILFICLHAVGFSEVQDTTSSIAADVVQNYTEEELHINWIKFADGVLLTAGQVYAVEDRIGSILILGGLFLNSPVLTLASVVGGLISSAVALLISSAPYNMIYAGVWGYNGFLAAGCITFFVNPSITGVIVAILNAIFAAFIQAGIIPVFAANNLPVFTFPFCLTSVLFLGLVQIIPGVSRVQELSFPEHHYWKQLEQKRRAKRQEHNNSQDEDFSDP